MTELDFEDWTREFIVEKFKRADNLDNAEAMELAMAAMYYRNRYDKLEKENRTLKNMIKEIDKNKHQSIIFPS